MFCQTCGPWIVSRRFRDLVTHGGTVNMAQVRRRATTAMVLRSPMDAAAPRIVDIITPAALLAAWRTVRTVSRAESTALLGSTVSSCPWAEGARERERSRFWSLPEFWSLPFPSPQDPWSPVQGIS